MNFDIDDILKYKIILKDYFFNLNFLNIISLLFIIFIFIKTQSILTKKKFFILLFIIIIFYIIIFLINNKMLTNKNYSSKYIKPENIEKSLNTGDIILFRNYEWDFLSYPLVAMVYCIFFNVFFTHIGIIHKDTYGDTYLIEMNVDPYYCNLKKKFTTGIQYLNFLDRVNNSKFHRIHAIRNNLHKFIDTNKINDVLMKYKDHNFGQDGLNCLNLVVKILEENNLYNNDGLFTTFDDIINPKNYKVPVLFDQPILIKEYVP